MHAIGRAARAMLDMPPARSRVRELEVRAVSPPVCVHVCVVRVQGERAVGPLVGGLLRAGAPPCRSVWCEERGSVSRPIV